VSCALAACSGFSCGAHGLVCIDGGCGCSGNGGVPQATETNCGDGHDNDCNGLIDCADPNCLGSTCSANGKVCASSNCVCSGNGGIAQATETACGDGHDNDCNGLIDCADPNCSGCPAGPTGWRAMLAPAPARGTAAAAQTNETICSDGHDNDCDGLLDCADSNCSGLVCGPNGRTCVGAGCACSGNGGLAQTTETICGDGHDNDCNGLTDCADPNCNHQPCSATGKTCVSSVCTCTPDGGAQPSETSCGDGLDNDWQRAHRLRGSQLPGQSVL